MICIQIYQSYVQAPPSFYLGAIAINTQAQQRKLYSSRVRSPNIPKYLRAISYFLPKNFYLRTN
ncbi:hypothetical protein [Iningainema tapete]|uniref:Uncharacterized protein n=1 Tax=Iningainema tapete BLCC-T55 TaxID=2748662 RepID=A0A8J6XN95_9CYAN|nr:hypothetical protein [Iningainema tapete]MBD2776352.1 hypothetical protein [Iningainema tapete BLCC-T55]